MPDDGPVLELRKITKRFPGVVANDSIDLDLRRGEVHALLGENGAGKSTLVNVLYGLYKPDEGEILLNGRQASFGSAKDAIEAIFSFRRRDRARVLEEIDPIDVVEERAAAVGDPAMQDAHVAAFADRRAVGPVATGRENREAAQPRGGRLGGGLAQRGEGTLTTGERAHLIWLSDGEQNDSEMFSI